MKPMTAEELAAAWLAAKADEDAAKARRYEIEAAIVAAIPGGDESTASAKFDAVKVTVSRKLTRSVDSAALQAAWAQLPSQAQAIFKWAADIDIRKMRAAQEMAPEIYSAAAAFITTKPAKAAVKVEAL